MHNSYGFDTVKELFSELARNIDGTLLTSEKFEMMKVIKDDVMVEYQFGDQDDYFMFVFATPLNFGYRKFSISNHKRVLDKLASIFTIGDRVKSISDYYVYSDENENTIKLLEAVLNDFEYKDCLVNLKNWTIEYENNTLIVYLQKSVEAIFGDKVTSEELIQVYEILRDTKRTIEFHMNRI